MDTDALNQIERAHHGGAADPDVLDFSANTNPKTPPGSAAVYRDAFVTAQRYSDDGYDSFREAAAGVVDCSSEQIIPTAGGLAALRLAVATTVSSGDSVLIPSPGFAEYAREVRLQGGTVARLPQPSIVTADTDSLADHTAVIVCTPNNPTGRLPDRDELLALVDRCRRVDTTVIVDEAFLGYMKQASLAGHNSVIALRSLTKLYGLPGLRAGYAVATGEHRDRLGTARRAWSLGTPAAAVGTHALKQSSFVEATRQRVERERERLRDQLSAADYGVSPSDAPFLLLAVGDRSVDRLDEQCVAAGIAIRDARTFAGLDNHVRIAVKDADANDRLLEVLCDD